MTAKFCLYLKFYETKIDKLKNWTRTFKNINGKCPIYIWIESYKPINDIIKENPYNLIFISHHNEKEFCQNIDEKDKQIETFINSVGITTKHINLCKAHLRSFYLPKEEYIYHIDGDDIFYLNLTYEMFERGYNYIIKNNLNILARPYWITIDHGFSFGFVLQAKNLINKMFINNPGKLPNDYKYEGFFKKNMDCAKGMNADNYFGMILFNYYKLKFREVFFAFKENPDWKSINIREPFINEQTTKNFIDMHKINII